MTLFNSFQFRPGAAPAAADDAASPTAQPHDWKRIALVIGLGGLSWVATYVGMLELIEANMGDLPLIHKLIIGFSVAMLMTMIVWLLDRMFAPGNLFTKTCYVAGYLFLSIISIGFGFGFYWKVLESRGEASRSAESAITQVQTSLFAAATRLEQLQSTLDQLTTVSSEKSEVEKSTGRSCPNSGPGDGPRRKMREEDAARFKFASDFVKGRVTTVKTDMSGLDADLQKIVKDDRSVIDAKTGTRNDFLRSVGRKLDLTVTGFNAFRTDPQLKQIRSDLGERAEKSTITGANGVTISCPDAQLQMALRGVVRAIDQLPELEKPKIAAVEGSEATIEAFRRLTTTFFGLMSFKLPPSADELRELQKKAVQSMELQAGDGSKPRAALHEQSAGLAKRDYVPLSVAIFVDLCLLLVSIGRPINRFVGMQMAIREAERGPVYPILQRFYDIHADDRRVKIFEVFREVIFDLNGHYHVAVPLNVPRYAENRTELKREAQHLANVCYALEGKGILVRPRSFMPTLLATRELKKRGSKFVECYGDRRQSRYSRSHQKPAFKVYRFQKGAWQEMILGAVMGAAHHAEKERSLQDAASRHATQSTPHLPDPYDTGRSEHGQPQVNGRDWWQGYRDDGSAPSRRHGESQMRSAGFDSMRPEARDEPNLDWPHSATSGNGRAYRGNGHTAGLGDHLGAASAADVLEPYARHAMEAEATPDSLAHANNNTGPAGYQAHHSDEYPLSADAPLTASEPVASVNVASALPLPRPETASDDLALTPAPTAQDPLDAPTDPDEAIAVDQISGWFGRNRNKA